MEQCDVVIIGGGPAGSSCAWALQQSGFDVLVLDKTPFPRDKVCAGWITLEVPDLLELEFDDYQQGRTLQPIKRFRTGLLDAPMMLTDYQETVSYGILRREFDDYLLRRSGARLALGEPLHDMRRLGTQWLINERIQAPLIIGAGGHNCPVAKWLNPQKDPSEEVVAAQEMEFEINAAQQAQCMLKADTPELYFLPEGDGYGWAVRKGNFLNIGLGRIEKRHLARYVARFRQFLIGQERVPADIPNKFLGHAYRLITRRRQRHILDDGVLLVGDALGLAHPQSGEGIRAAIESGLLAAETIKESEGVYQKELLSTYQRKLDIHFATDERQARVSLPISLKHLLARPLLKSHYFTRRVLLDKWFLHRK